MQLSKWKPFSNIESFINFPVSGLFDEMSNGVGNEWRPAVDFIEKSDEFLVKAELPEVKKEDVKINIENNILSVQGERRYEEKDEKQHRLERFYGSFTRSFTLPDNVDTDQCKAEFKDGMLNIHLPKKAGSEKPKKSIEIK